MNIKIRIKQPYINHVTFFEFKFQAPRCQVVWLNYLIGLRFLYHLFIFRFFQHRFTSAHVLVTVSSGHAVTVTRKSSTGKRN